jgi:transcriptional regulator with XRE-family HTH domain
MTVGKRFAEERKRLRMTQDQIARFLNVGRSALAMVEADKNGLDVARLATLAVIGMDTNYVLCGKRPEETIDWSLVAKVLTALDTWCRSHDVTLGPEKTARALKILYMHFRRAGIVDEPYLAELMDLAA